MRSYLADLPVIGCSPYEGGKSGFALPVLVDPDDFSAVLVQEIDEISGKISSFKVVEGDLTVVALSAAVQAVAGQDPVYAFIDDDGSVHAGTSSQLAGMLRRFAHQNPGRHSVNLQIIELIGTSQEKKVARASMHQTIVKQAGANAAASFYSATLRSVLWSSLLSLAKSEEVARRILRARSKLSASIENGSLSFDLRAISPDDREAINAQALEDKILLEFDLQPLGESADPAPSSTNYDADLVQKKATELIHRISRCSRQEERMAVLMDAIIADRSIGLTALLRYQDRAKFANWTLDLLRERFFQKQQKTSNPKFFIDEKNTPFDTERTIADLVPKLFTRNYPLTRGELLFSLAKHLGKWPMINTAIKRSLDRTASMFVENWRAATDDMLIATKAQTTKAVHRT